MSQQPPQMPVNDRVRQFHKRTRIRAESTSTPETGANLYDVYPNVNPFYRYTAEDIQNIIKAYLAKRRLSCKPGTGIVQHQENLMQVEDDSEVKSTFSLGNFEHVAIDAPNNHRENFKLLRERIGTIIESNNLGLTDISKHMIVVPFSARENHIALALMSFELEKVDAQFYLKPSFIVQIDDPSLGSDDYYQKVADQLYHALFRYSNPHDILEAKRLNVNLSRIICKQVNDDFDYGVVVVNRMVEFLDHNQLSPSYDASTYSVGELYHLRKRHISTWPALSEIQSENMPSKETIASMITSRAVLNMELEPTARFVDLSDSLNNQFQGNEYDGLPVGTAHEVINGSKYTGQFVNGRRKDMGQEENPANVSGYGVETSFNGSRDAEGNYLDGDICAIIGTAYTYDIKDTTFVGPFKLLFQGKIKNGVINGGPGKIFAVGLVSEQVRNPITGELEHQLVHKSIQVCTVSSFTDGVVNHHDPINPDFFISPSFYYFGIATCAQILNSVVCQSEDNKEFRHRFYLHKVDEYLCPDNITWHNDKLESIQAGLSANDLSVKNANSTEKDTKILAGLLFERKVLEKRLSIIQDWLNTAQSYIGKPGFYDAAFEVRKGLIQSQMPRSRCNSLENSSLSLPLTSSGSPPVVQSNGVKRIRFVEGAEAPSGIVLPPQLTLTQGDFTNSGVVAVPTLELSEQTSGAESNKSTKSSSHQADSKSDDEEMLGMPAQRPITHLLDVRRNSPPLSGLILSRSPRCSTEATDEVEELTRKLSSPRLGGKRE